MKIKDTLKDLSTKGQDTMNFIIDTLQQHPYTKGVIPAATSIGVSFVDVLETGLRIVAILFAIVASALTGYAQWIKIKKEKKDL